MRSAFKRYKLLKLTMGEEKMPEEGDARDRWIEKSAVLYDLILQSVNNDMFQHIKDLVELDDSGPKAWKVLRDVIQPNTLPMVIVLEKELAALSMRPGDDVKPVLDKIKDTYARMAAAGSNVSQMQQCTKIISVLDNSWDNLIPTLNTQQDQWTPEWLRQQILQEDFRMRHTGGGAANKTAEGYGAAGGSRGRGGGRGRGRGRGFGRGRGRGAQGDGAHGKADPGMFLMVEDVKGSEGDVGSVGKVVMHPLTHWVIDSGCTSHMTPRADLLDEVKPPGKVNFVAAASGALLPVIGIGNAKVIGANGGLVGLGNVLLVEGLSANLLSVRWLQKSKAKVTFGPTSCRAKLGKLLLWDLEEKSSCIKDLWQLPIIPWNGKPPATAAAAATAKATTGGEETAATAKATAPSAPTYGALDAVKKVQQPQQPHGEVLAGMDATAAWAKASSGNVGVVSVTGVGVDEELAIGAGDVVVASASADVAAVAFVSAAADVVAAAVVLSPVHSSSSLTPPSPLPSVADFDVSVPVSSPTESPMASFPLPDDLTDRGADSVALASVASEPAAPVASGSVAPAARLYCSRGASHSSSPSPLLR
ncbi:unnamed protein product [Closterium sp. NIES-54]